MSRTPETQQPPLDQLLVQSHAAELHNRAMEPEMQAAILVIATRLIASASLGDDKHLDSLLDTFRRDAIMARAQMKGVLQGRAMVEKARGGGHAH